MTPTEQEDKELREAIRKDFHQLLVKEFTADWKIQRIVRDLEIDVISLDNTMQLITADRKRVALEAGIEAVKQYNRVLTDNLPPKPEYTAIGLDGIVAVYRQVEIGEAVRKANNQCIAELKAQQEEL